MLATGVILWHSFPLTGRHIPYEPVHQFLEDVWVDGFFAVSGFLITASWLSRPRPRAYFAARALRLLPGLWCCLIVTAFIIAPLSVAFQGGSVADLLRSHAPIGYILKNGAVMTLQTDVGGTPSGVPIPHQWNGSLWTLQWEVLCYIAVAVFGLIAVARRRWVIPVALILTLVCSALLPPWNILTEHSPGMDARVVDPATVLMVEAAMAARFITMFLAGALLYQIRNSISAQWSLVFLNGAIVFLAMLLPNYRLVAAISLAYVIIVSGTLIRNRRLRLRTDLSYGLYIYAFPMQQLLIIFGFGELHPIVFAVIATIATLPLAALSWFLVEKPALSLKSRLENKRSARRMTRASFSENIPASEPDERPDLTAAS
ncbi:acyltransferase [Mycobacterium mantenii]|uniref:Acyltransferase n=1 Tax=Mycobacterium mantenii TaxID=560555 RepID=A0A1A2SV32_MYCNT|nr:acyltransferase [Mycobacterium mantenii]OBH67956.1 acyltransferase [Mycobacterium mantenii]